MEAPSIEQHWFTVFCRKHFAELIVSLLTAIACSAGTGLVTGVFWASSVNTKIASIDEKLTDFKDDARLQSERVEKIGDILSAHGERVSALEAARR